MRPFIMPHTQQIFKIGAVAVGLGVLTSAPFIIWQNQAMVPIWYLLLAQAVFCIGLVTFVIWFYSLRLTQYYRTLGKQSGLSHEVIQKIFHSLEEIAIVSITDDKGKITFANEHFCRISGYSAEELIGKDHRLINSGHHPKEFFQMLWKTIQRGEMWQGEIKNINKNGEYYWVKTYIVPLKDKHGQREYISFRFEITDEKGLEEAYRQEHLKNIHMSRLAALGEMVGTTAHEINNPMAAIGAYLSFMSKCLKAEDVTQYSVELNENISKARLQIQRILKIINGLREFVRSGENAESEVVNLKTIVENAVTLCSTDLQKKEIQVEIQVQDLYIKVNPIQLEQVFVNLLINAADAVSLLPERWIRIQARSTGTSVQIQVVDSGNGISEKIAERIMLPFFTTKNKDSGTGLGLSISRGIVEQQEGQLYLDRTAVNTTFVVHLPVYTRATRSFPDDFIAHHVRHRQKIIELLNGKFIVDPEGGFEEVLADISKWHESIESHYKAETDFDKFQKIYQDYTDSVRSLLQRSQRNDRTAIYDATQGSSSLFDLQSRKIVGFLQSLKSSMPRASSQ